LSTAKNHVLPGPVFLKSVLILMLILTAALETTAQERCAFDIVRAQRQQENKAEPERKFEKWLQNKKSTLNRFETLGTKENRLIKYQIPVVIHIIHNGEPIGSGRNLSHEQVISQIKVLNQDYQRLNADTLNTPEVYKPLAANIQLEFVLAKTDPNGLATNGITRTFGSRSSYSVTSNEVEVKSLSYWPAEDYMNIWVASLSGGFLGFSTFPVSDLPGIDEPEYNRLLDGIIIDYRAFGSINDGDFPDLEPQYNRGRTTTHEVGHYLGLKHLWGNNTGDCTEDDYCDDTPLTTSGTSGCPSGKTECDSEDMIQNYMDYTDDVCMNLFTNCQKLRIITVMENSPRRKSLLTSPGLNSPLENSYDLVLRDILQPSYVFCAANFTPLIEIQNLGTTQVDSIQVDYVIDNDHNGSFKVYNLNLEQGEIKPVELPEVVLDQGQYSIEFSINNLDNINGDYNPFNNNKNQKFAISDASDFLPYLETFNSGELAFTDWTLLNPDSQNSWLLTESGRDDNGGAVKMSFFNYQNTGQQDWLVSPVIDLSGAVQPTLTFQLAYAFQQNRNDNLKILVSRDCGQTFDEVVYEKSGPALSTAFSESEWEPETENDWRKEIIDLAAFIGESQLRFALVATNSGGNNLYLDEFELFLDNEAVEAELDYNSILLHPNPARGKQVKLTFALDKRENVQVLVYNSIGRRLSMQHLDNVLNQTINLQLPSLPTGIYLVQVKSSSINRTVKMILQ